MIPQTTNRVTIDAHKAIVIETLQSFCQMHDTTATVVWDTDCRRYEVTFGMEFRTTRSRESFSMAVGKALDCYIDWYTYSKVRINPFGRFTYPRDN